ncbi:MAG TPA: type I methionyl aminopeptidase [Candidatus Saccharimonadales bacterium]|nr:type I methionyl aminopeptidase [Candidatus Saccharimonadales bacterium]
MFTSVKTATEIQSMRESGHMLANVLRFLEQHTIAGLSTKKLADMAVAELHSLGGEPAFLGYQGFPDVLCTSINNEVVHGIPSEQKILQEGDILSLDFGVQYRGMITDAAISTIVGKPLKRQHADLVQNTHRALLAGIDAVHHGVRTGDIGATVEAQLSKHHYGIVRDLVGHGVGHYLHEDPNVPNYGKRHTGAKLSKGMTIAIEPMATLGEDKVYVADDGWTVLTWDASWSAHFEHTVLIEDSAAEILTAI